MLPRLAGHLHSVSPPQGEGFQSRGWKKADKGSKSWSSQPTGFSPRPLGPSFWPRNSHDPTTGGHVCSWSHGWLSGLRVGLR